MESITSLRLRRRRAGGVLERALGLHGRPPLVDQLDGSLADPGQRLGEAARRLRPGAGPTVQVKRQADGDPRDALLLDQLVQGPQVALEPGPVQVAGGKRDLCGVVGQREADAPGARDRVRERGPSWAGSVARSPAEVVEIPATSAATFSLFSPPGRLTRSGTRRYLRGVARLPAEASARAGPLLQPGSEQGPRTPRSRWKTQTCGLSARALARRGGFAPSRRRRGPGSRLGASWRTR